MKNKNISDEQLDKYFWDELPEAESHLVKKMLLNDMLAWHRLKKTEEVGMNQSDSASEIASASPSSSIFNNIDTVENKAPSPVSILKRKSRFISGHLALAIAFVITCPIQLHKTDTYKDKTQANKDNEKKANQNLTILNNKVENTRHEAMPPASPKPITGQATLQKSTERRVTKTDKSSQDIVDLPNNRIIPPANLDESKNLPQSTVSTSQEMNLSKSIVIVLSNSITPPVSLDKPKSSVQNDLTTVSASQEINSSKGILQSARNMADEDKQRKIDELIKKIPISNSENYTEAEKKQVKQLQEIQKNKSDDFEDELKAALEKSPSAMNKYILALYHAKLQDDKSARELLNLIKIDSVSQALRIDIQQLQELVQSKPNDK